MSYKITLTENRECYTKCLRGIALYDCRMISANASYSVSSIGMVKYMLNVAEASTNTPTEDRSISSTSIAEISKQIQQLKTFSVIIHNSKNSHKNYKI